MKVTDFNKEVSKREGKLKELSIAQIAEVVKVTKDIILEKFGVDLYKDIIRKI